MTASGHATGTGRLRPKPRSQNGSHPEQAGIIQSRAPEDKGQPACQVTLLPALSSFS